MVSQTAVEGGDLLCDAVDVDAQLVAVRVGVQVVRTEDDVRVDCWDEAGDGNNRAGLRGLFGGCVNFSCDVREGRTGQDRTGQTYCVRPDPDATVPKVCVSMRRGSGWKGGLLTDGANGGHVDNDGESLLEGWEAG